MRLPVIFVVVLVVLILTSVVITVLGLLTVSAQCEVMHSSDQASECEYYLMVTPAGIHHDGKTFNYTLSGNSDMCEDIRSYGNGTKFSCHYLSTRRSKITLGVVWYSDVTVFAIASGITTFVIMLSCHVCLKKMSNAIIDQTSGVGAHDQSQSKPTEVRTNVLRPRSIDDEIRDKELIPVLRADNWNCIICLEGLDDSENNRAFEKLNCGHTFHYSCWSSWAVRIKKNRCPLCNRMQ